MHFVFQVAYLPRAGETFQEKRSARPPAGRLRAHSHPPHILELGPNQAWNVSHVSAGRGKITSVSLEIGNQKSWIWSNAGETFQQKRSARSPAGRTRARATPWLCLSVHNFTRRINFTRDHTVEYDPFIKSQLASRDEPLGFPCGFG